jgi:hypothetical protein
MILFGALTDGRTLSVLHPHVPQCRERCGVGSGPKGLAIHPTEARRAGELTESLTRQSFGRCPAGQGLDERGKVMADEEQQGLVPVGAEYSATLCDLGVFVDEAAQPVSSDDLDVVVDGFG